MDQQLLILTGLYAESAVFAVLAFSLLQRISRGTKLSLGLRVAVYVTALLVSTVIYVLIFQSAFGWPVGIVALVILALMHQTAMPFLRLRLAASFLAIFIVTPLCIGYSLYAYRQSVRTATVHVVSQAASVLETNLREQAALTRTTGCAATFSFCIQTDPSFTVTSTVPDGTVPTGFSLPSALPWLAPLPSSTDSLQGIGTFVADAPYRLALARTANGYVLSGLPFDIAYLQRLRAQADSPLALIGPGGTIVVSTDTTGLGTLFSTADISGYVTEHPSGSRYIVSDMDRYLLSATGLSGISGAPYALATLKRLSL